MRNFIEEFKKFINKGNAIELAVGVVVGSAFTTIVNSIVNDIISPIIGRIVGGFDFSNITLYLGGDSHILIGKFIQSVINFIIIAFVLFIVVKAMNKANEKILKKENEEKTKEDSNDIKLLKSIESELKKLNKKLSKMK